MQTRQYGFSIRCSKLAEFTETLTLPEGYKVQWKPSFNAVKNDAAEFDALYSVDGRQLKLKADHTMHKRLYESSDWPGFKAALNERHKLIQSTIILQK